MMGRPDEPDLKGLIPRSLEQIFQTSQSLKDQGWKYTMQVSILHPDFQFSFGHIYLWKLKNLIEQFQASILEIYCDTIRDLLLTNRSSDHARTENSASTKQYTISHDANGNTHVSDLTIKDVCSADEISSLLRQAAQSRYMVFNILIMQMVVLEGSLSELSG